MDVDPIGVGGGMQCEKYEEDLVSLMVSWGGGRGSRRC